MTCLGPGSVIGSLDKAYFALVFELVRILACHVVLCLAVRSLIVVCLQYLVCILWLGIAMDWILISNFVWRVLLGRVDLLLRVPVDIGAVVISVRWVLELCYHILLVCSSHVWLAKGGLIVWEVAQTVAILLWAFLHTQIVVLIRTVYHIE